MLTVAAASKTDLSENDIDILHKKYDGMRVELMVPVNIIKNGKKIKTIAAGVKDKIIVDSKEYTVGFSEFNIEV